MPKHILVVNDTQEILELFRSILRGAGYDVSLMTFGLREIESLRAVHSDLIILDYIISAEDDGWQTLQKLKMIKDLATVPVIVCVAASQRVKDMEGRLTEKGVMIVLKPFDIADLLSAVKMMTGDEIPPLRLNRNCRGVQRAYREEHSHGEAHFGDERQRGDTGTVQRFAHRRRL